MSLLTSKIPIENKQGARIVTMLSETGIYAVNRNNLSEKIFKELRACSYKSLQKQENTIK